MDIRPVLTPRQQFALQQLTQIIQNHQHIKSRHSQRACCLKMIILFIITVSLYSSLPRDYRNSIVKLYQPVRDIIYHQENPSWQPAKQAVTAKIAAKT